MSCPFPALPGKATRAFSVDTNSKQGELLDHTCTEKFLGSQKREWCQSYPKLTLLESILAERRMHTCGRILKYTKYELWTRQTTTIGQRKPRKNVLQKWFKSPWGCASLWAHSCVYPQVLDSFPPNKHFVSLLSFFVGILFYKAEKPGPCHWPLV